MDLSKIDLGQNALGKLNIKISDELSKIDLSGFLMLQKKIAELKMPSVLIQISPLNKEHISYLTGRDFESPINYPAIHQLHREAVINVIIED